MVSIAAHQTPEHTLQRIGPGYHLVEEISRGPTASIYRATLPEGSQPVAIKLFNSHYSNEPRFAIRFREHMRRLVELSHANLVTVLDYGIAGERYYIVMEWVEGIDL